MFFCYPIEAIDDNWLNVCLSEMVNAAIEHINSGNDPQDWPDCIPAAYREQIRTRTGLRDRFRSLCNTLRSLNDAGRVQVQDALKAQNDQPAVFDGQSPCPCISDLPQEVRKPITDLFRFAFGLLAELKLRDQHYEKIYARLPTKVCPFCGCEYFDAPGAPRHDLDHYLPISKYPFAGANLRNLVPMGDRCNTAYKRQNDILVDEAGHRRRCFDPYGGDCGKLSLLESRPFERDQGRLPDWQVDLGQFPESETWDQVWQIRLRYKRDILDVEFRHWLEHFAQWCRRKKSFLANKGDVLKALDDYVEEVTQEGFSDRAFLKRAVFDMLKAKASAGPYEKRVVDFIIDLASSDMGAAA